MTSIWQKIRKQQPKHVDSASVDESLSQKKIEEKSFINPSDEELYFERQNNGLKNPIDGRSQIVQTLDEILACPSSNFAAFLDSEGACPIWNFLNDCKVYKSYFDQLESKKDAKDTKIPPNESKEISQMSLPDLVSNIPKDAMASPMPSPEKKIEDDQRKQETVIPKECEDFNHCIWNYHSTKSSEQSEDSFSQISKLIYYKALDIFNTYIRPNCDSSIPLSTITQQDIAHKVKESKFDHQLFDTSEEEIYSILNQQYLTKFINSEYYLKHKVDILTSSNVRLPDIINCDNSFPFFMEYMEIEGASLLLEFWISISNFRQHLSSLAKEGAYNGEQAQEDAMILYDKYFSMQASSPLGFSHAIRFMVESSICQEKGLDAQCFDVPLGIVFLVIERDYFRQYISSSFHIKCLTELISSAQTSSVKKHRRTVSETTSRSSTSDRVSVISSPSKCTNTLLAMDTSKTIKALEENLSMRIDSQQILDPESLWRRKNFKRLSCGYIDQLGRFESELLPDPFKQESRLAKLRKFISSEESKLKEEMAYQVAEMIIKDVLNITLNH